ncbi:MAG: divergent polysaccharide deacetylase family protein, partial [Candidatus Marinimicrobia bacterium]|nr:divergent polysaccharide deacetylase family protein [Candidatus Neomarinimicrobiota bacterium]
MKNPFNNFRQALSSLSVASILVLVVVLATVILIILLVKPAEKELREPGPIVKLPEVAKPITPSKGQIAIIIDDFGYNFEQYTRSFLDFNARLTFAVIPGHNYSQRFATAAAKAGFEVMIHMPMETLNGSR